MLNIKIGAIKAAAISEKPIVPAILEYVEVPELCSKENELYSKCVVKLGEPISVDLDRSLIEQNDNLQAVLKNMRTEIRKKYGVYREDIDDVDPHVYVNHTWLKKYGSPLFDFDSEKEEQFIYLKPGETLENEWHFDKDGIFKPGIIAKEDEHFIKE